MNLFLILWWLKVRFERFILSFQIRQSERRLQDSLDAYEKKGDDDAA